MRGGGIDSAVEPGGRESYGGTHRWGGHLMRGGRWADFGSEGLYARA